MESTSHFEIVEQRVSTLLPVLQKAIGCRVQFMRANEITRSDWTIDQIAPMEQRSWRSPFYEHKRSPQVFGVPVDLEGWLIGLIVVIPDTESELNEYTSQQLISMSQLIRRSLGIADEAPSEPERHLQLVVTPESLRFTSTHFYLVSAHEELAMRLALELHSLSGRAGFVSRERLGKDFLRDEMALDELGATTLFIGNIENWDLQEQKMVANYLNDYPDTPLRLIVSSHRNAGDMIRLGKIDASLFMHLKSFAVSDSRAMTFRDWVNVHMRRLVVESDPLRFH